MKTLKTLFEDIGTIEAFNDLVMTYLSGDEDYIGESLIEGEETTPSPHHYMGILYNKGYRYENFPWKEFRDYCLKVSNYLENELIIPLP